MTIDISSGVEEQLKDLAVRQGRNVDALVEEAVRNYLELEAMTDLEPAEIAETQVALMAELSGVSVWKDQGE